MQEKKKEKKNQYNRVFRVTDLNVYYCLSDFLIKIRYGCVGGCVHVSGTKKDKKKKKQLLFSYTFATLCREIYIGLKEENE